MNDIAVRVENLGKLFHIGSRQVQHQTLRDVLTEAFVAPLRRAGKLLRGQTSGASELDETIWALQNISFEIKQGEAVGIIGRNGAGKSTLLKLLSRISEPTQGSIDLYGRVGSLLEVGTGFHPELTGRENIYLNGAILGMSRAHIDHHFDEIVDFAEVEKFIDTPVKHYSSGMYLRLAFAVAAHLEPEILIVDEVLAVGDANFQRKCLGKMGDVAHAGRTVLFVSHNMGAINNLCQRAIWIDRGSIAKDGPATTVVSAYLNSGSSNAGQKVWSEDTRPGNGAFKLTQVALTTATGEIASEINISENAWVDIEFEVIRPDARVIFALIVYDATGAQILASLNNGPENSAYNVQLPKGHYRARCQIYGNLLNDGRYYLSIIGLTDHWTEHFQTDNVLIFEALDDGVLRRDYQGGYASSIRPKLLWNTLALTDQLFNIEELESV
jgi:lipopolysaccharide transport system ATP-binding protein